MAKIKLDPKERDRLYEVIFYYYFRGFDSRIITKQDFWMAIKHICQLYKIEATQVSLAFRVLSTPENAPQDLETYYLLNKIGTPVRAINRMTGIYWQKQVALTEQLDKIGIPVITRRVTDIVMKDNIVKFIRHMSTMSGILNDVDMDKII